MDALTFIAEIFKAVAWPGTVLVIILLLRRPLRDLIPLMTRLKYKEIEVEFGQKIAELKVEVAKDLAEEKQIDEKIIRLAEVSPRAAVLESWRSIEKEALESSRYLSQLKGVEHPVIPPHRAFDILRREEKIDEDTLNILDVLRSLRNKAAHEEEFAISTWLVLEYADMAKRLAEKLKNIRGV